MSGKNFKEWFDCKDEKEQDQKWHELKSKGYNPWDIYKFNYQGRDGNFHREIFVR